MSTVPAKIVSVVGARPQFVKAAVVAEAIAQTGARHVLIHTGQHYDWEMSEIFFRDLGIERPHHFLAIGSGAHGAQTGAMLQTIEPVLSEERPDWVVVYGDTNSTLAGALAAAKLHQRVAHVEAGLRSFNRRMPEEVNRVLTDHLSDLLFVPTPTAVRNLEREGISGERVVQVGDVMYDAALRYADANGGVVDRLGLRRKEYVLATVHRAENTDDAERLGAIVAGLIDAAGEREVVLPLHPRTARSLERTGLDGAARSALRIVEPVGYIEMLELEAGAALIVTDSGGVQKEAFFQRVPCVTLRDETEWVELVELGWNRLVPPTSGEAVAEGIRRALAAPAPAEPAQTPYGGGSAATLIALRLTSSTRAPA